MGIWDLGGLTWKQLIKAVIHDFSEDDLANQSAQLSYYFLFALFPLLLFLTALLGLFVEPGSVVHHAITQYAGKVLPQAASGLIDKTLREVSHNAGADKLSLGIIFALWSASSGMSAVINSLNVAYDVKTPRPWWKEKLLSLVMTIAVSLFLIIAFVLAVYGGAIAETISDFLHLGGVFTWAWKILQWPVLLLLVLIAFNLIYYFAPHCEHLRWHWLMPGTIVGVGLWLIASLAFKLYLTYFNTYSVTYGSIGTIIILLLWFYISGIALLIGGEVNAEIEQAFGRQKAAQAAQQNKSQ